MDKVDPNIIPYLLFIRFNLAICLHLKNSSWWKNIVNSFLPDLNSMQSTRILYIHVKILVSDMHNTCSVLNLLYIHHALFLHLVYAIIGIEQLCVHRWSCFNLQIHYCWSERAWKFHNYSICYWFHSWWQSTVGSNLYKARNLQVLQPSSLLLSSTFVQSYEYFIFDTCGREKVLIRASKPFIVLQGEGASNTIIDWNDHGDTKNCATFIVYASDFVARDITFSVRTLLQTFLVYIYVYIEYAWT